MASLLRNLEEFKIIIRKLDQRNTNRARYELVASEDVELPVHDAVPVQRI